VCASQPARCSRLPLELLQLKAPPPKTAPPSVVAQTAIRGSNEQHLREVCSCARPPLPAHSRESFRVQPCCSAGMAVSTQEDMPSSISLSASGRGCPCRYGECMPYLKTEGVK
jgi:hypothetical protein